MARGREDLDCRKNVITFNKLKKQPKTDQKKKYLHLPTPMFQPLYEVNHCNKMHYTLAKPTACPSCNQAVEPIEHKNPVGRSKPRSICIKQTFHSFKNYKSDSFLHCGVSNAAGAVYHFDEGGMHMDVKWPECLSIPIVWDQVSDEIWDLMLEQHYGDEQSLLDYRPYHGINNNCYSFIIRYLELIGFEDKKEHTKEDIVKRFVSTPMDAFESFYNIQKKLQSQSSYVCDMDEMRREKLRNRAVNCDGCNKTNIHKEAVYYHCEDCSDFDLCNECFNSKKVVGDHKVEHKTLRMTTH